MASSIADTFSVDRLLFFSGQTKADADYLEELKRLSREGRPVETPKSELIETCDEASTTFNRAYDFQSELKSDQGFPDSTEQATKLDNSLSKLGRLLSVFHQRRHLLISDNVWMTATKSQEKAVTESAQDCFDFSQSLRLSILEAGDYMRDLKRAFDEGLSMETSDSNLTVTSNKAQVTLNHTYKLLSRMSSDSSFPEAAEGLKEAFSKLSHLLTAPRRVGYLLSDNERQISIKNQEKTVAGWNKACLDLMNTNFGLAVDDPQ